MSGGASTVGLVTDISTLPRQAAADLADWLGAAGQAQLDEAQIDEARIDEALLADVLELREAIDAEVLGTGLRDRLRICPGPGCGGRFADDSPAGRRRWCSMAVCGNRNKAATHRVTVRKR